MCTTKGKIYITKWNCLEDNAQLFELFIFHSKIASNCTDLQHEDFCVLGFMSWQGGLNTNFTAVLFPADVSIHSKFLWTTLQVEKCLTIACEHSHMHGSSDVTVHQASMSVTGCTRVSSWVGQWSLSQLCCPQGGLNATVWTSLSYKETTCVLKKWCVYKNGNTIT